MYSEELEVSLFPSKGPLAPGRRDEAVLEVWTRLADSIMVETEDLIGPLEPEVTLMVEYDGSGG